MTTTRLGAVCAGILMVIGGAVQAAPISGQGTWETTLQGRDLDGDLATFEAYYDTVLDITWLADANYAYTSGYQTLNDGRMTWTDANAWAAGLDINGYTGWRLPSVAPINGTSFNSLFSNNATTDRGDADADGWVDGSGAPVSEMGHLFYTTLGNLGRCTPSDVSPSSCIIQTGFGLSNTGPFSNIKAGYNYWSDTGLGTSHAWVFLFGYGRQDYTNRSDLMSAWVVHSGDVGASAVPAPAAAWLFGSGLIGLLGAVSRRR